MQPQLVLQNGHRQRVVDLAFEPRGRMLASAGIDNTVKIWDVAQRRLLANLRVGLGRPTALLWTDDSRALVVSGTGGAAIFDALDGRRRQLTSQLTEAMAWADGGRLLVGWNKRGAAWTWSLGTAVAVRKLTVGNRLSVGRRYLATLDRGGEFNRVALTTGQTSSSWHLRAGRARQIAISPSDEVIAVGADDGHVEVFDAHTGGLLAALDELPSSVERLAFGPKSQQLALVCRSQVRVVDWKQDRLIAKLATPRPIRWLHWLGSTGKLAWSSRQGALVLDPATAEAVKVGPGGDYDAFELADDGWGWAAQHQDVLSIRMLLGKGATAGDVLFEQKDFRQWLSLAWAPDGRSFAAGAESGRVVLFDGRTGRVMHELAGIDYGAEHLVFSADGRWLLGLGQRHERLSAPLLWDVASGRIVRQFDGYSGQLAAVAVTADGRWVVGGGWGKAGIFLWNAHSGAREQQVGTDDEHVVSALAFVDDDKTLVAVVRSPAQSNGTGSCQMKTYHWGDQGNDRLIPAQNFPCKGYGDDQLVPVPASPPKLLWDASGKALELWDLRTGAVLATAQLSDSFGRALAISAQARSVAGGGRAGLSLWQQVDIHGNSLGKPTIVAAHVGPANALAWHPHGRVLAAVGEGEIRFHRPADGAWLSLVTAAGPERLHAALSTPTGLHGGEPLARSRLVYRLGPGWCCSPLLSAAELGARYVRENLLADFVAGGALEP